MAVMTEAAGGRAFPRLHWSAVIAGVFVAIAAHIMLGLVGATLGLAAEPADSEGVGAAAAIWALVTPFVATLLGAWLACRMAGTEGDQRGAYVHAVLVWCIGLVAGALFLAGTLATGLVSAGAASGSLGSAGPMFGQGAAASRADARMTEAQADEAARRAAAGTAGAALGTVAGLLGAVVGAGLAGRRSEGKGLGWRIAIQRREEARPREGRAYPGAYGAEGRAPGPGAQEVGPQPGDPYHH